MPKRALETLIPHGSAFGEQAKASPALPTKAKPTTPSFLSPDRLIDHYRAKADHAEKLFKASSTKKGLKTIRDAMKSNPWYATDHAFTQYAVLINACRIAYAQVFVSREPLGAEPADLLSQTGRWVVGMYLFGINLFRVEFLIHLGRRQTAPVNLGFRAATCYVGLGLNVGQTLTEILLNIWNGLPDRELTYEQIVELNREFKFDQSHVELIRGRVELEFGLGHSVEVDRKFEEVRIGIQQERAVMAPVDGDTTLWPRAQHLESKDTDKEEAWLDSSTSRRQVWSKPNSVRGWSKVFGVSYQTMKAQLKKGTVRNSDKLGPKLIRVHVDDLPPPPGSAQ